MLILIILFSLFKSRLSNCSNLNHKFTSGPSKIALTSSAFTLNIICNFHLNSAEYQLKNPKNESHEAYNLFSIQLKTIFQNFLDFSIFELDLILNYQNKGFSNFAIKSENLDFLAFIFKDFFLEKRFLDFFVIINPIDSILAIRNINDLERQFNFQISDEIFENCFVSKSEDKKAEEIEQLDLSDFIKNNKTNRISTNKITSNKIFNSLFCKNLREIKDSEHLFSYSKIDTFQSPFLSTKNIHILDGVQLNFHNNLERFGVLNIFETVKKNVKYKIEEYGELEVELMLLSESYAIKIIEFRKMKLAIQIAIFDLQNKQFFVSQSSINDLNSGKINENLRILIEKIEQKCKKILFLNKSIFKNMIFYKFKIETAFKKLKVVNNENKQNENSNYLFDFLVAIFVVTVFLMVR